MKLTQEQKVRIRKHLKQLGEGKVLPSQSRYGICDEVYYKFGDPLGDTKILYKYFKTWDKFSGSLRFPVSTCAVYDSKGYISFEGKGHFEYVVLDDKWGDNEYGDLRRDLCLHIAEEMKKEINEEKGHAWLRICIR